MTRFRRLSALIAGTALLSFTVVGTPVSAQFGGIVFDPRNYAQNILTAARSLQQINNQITSLQNQAQGLVNQARNLASLPTNALSSIQQSIDRTRQLIAQAQQVAYNVQDIDRVFAARYPSGSLGGTSSGQLVANAETRWHDAVGAFQDSLRTQATIVTNLDDTRTKNPGSSASRTTSCPAAAKGRAAAILSERVVRTGGIPRTVLERWLSIKYRPKVSASRFDNIAAGTT